jgi:tetratricopeptide (TPR) repeat protein
LFDVQDEVSEAIASNLLSQLSGEEAVTIKANRPSNIEAYEYFLKAEHIHYFEQVEAYREEGKDAAERLLKTSEEMLKKAIALDPKFADSYASLANVYNSFYYVFSKTDEEKKKNWDLQKAYLDTALYLNPNSAEVYYVMNYLHFMKGEEYFKAEEYNKFEHELDEEFNCLRRALKNNKNHEKAFFALGMFFRKRGLDNLSIKCLNKSSELNPLKYGSYSVRGAEYFRIGEYKKAEVDFQKVLEVHPDAKTTLYRFSQLLIAMNKYEEAEKMLDRIEEYYPDSNTNWERALIYASKGEQEKALDIYKDKSMAVYSLLGMKEEAISIGTEWSERQLLQKFSRYYFLKNHPYYENIRSDSRFQEIVAKHKKLYEENLAKYGDVDI